MSDIETRWANHCPRCDTLHERSYGPGRHATADRCPDCNWPFNVVDPPRWSNHCPRCDTLHERNYGPGRYRTVDLCPDCNWPFNVVDPDVYTAGSDGETFGRPEAQL